MFDKMNILLDPEIKKKLFFIFFQLVTVYSFNRNDERRFLFTDSRRLGATQCLCNYCRLDLHMRSLTDPFASFVGS